MTRPASIGRYTVLGELGRGAMGVVYRAVDPALDRPVAIKVIAAQTSGLPVGSGELEARFLREARMAARISHPNVVTVYDAGREGDALYLVMELVDGESLSARLARQGFPPPAEALELVAQAAEALAAAHALGVVHRDVKPGNIMVTRLGRVKVADFGVAKAIGEETDLTRTGTVVGSPAYMAPEQVRGERVDGRADLFSLGVVTYELLLRRRPFPAETVTTLIYQILHQDPLADPDVLRTLGADTAAFLRACLAKVPGERIPDAGAFAAQARRLAGRLARADSVTTAPTAKIDSHPAARTAVPGRNRRVWYVAGAAAVGLAALAVAALLVHRTARAPQAPAVAALAPVPTATAVPTPAARVRSRTVARAAVRSASPPPRAVTGPGSATVAVAAAVPPVASRSTADPTRPPVVAIYYCQRGAEFNVSPAEAVVAVDGAVIGQADNGDHRREDRKYMFPRPGRHYVQLSAPGFRTTWIAIVVDLGAPDEIAEIDTILPAK